MVAEAIVKNLHQKIFDEVITHADIPMELDNREDLTKIENTYSNSAKNQEENREIEAEREREGTYVRD